MRVIATKELILAATFIPLAIGADRAGASPLPPPLPAPLSHQMIARLKATDPSRLAGLIAPKASGRENLAYRLPKSSPWQSMPHLPVPTPGAMFQMTDGSLLIQDNGSQNNGTGNWWRLAPDNSGAYATGTWTQLASLPSGYAPLFYASGTLPDGRFIVEGGEYNSGALTWTNQGAIYDPIANTWTMLAPPDGGSGEWVRIGDGPSTLLANGTFFFGASGYSGTTVEALFDPLGNLFTDTGTGKADGNGEEGFSLLPNGKVLTVDAQAGAQAQNSELYDPTTGSWSSAGSTPVALPSGGEIGPQLIRPDGTVLAVGASGHNAIFNSATASWSTGPDFPKLKGQYYDEADGPGAVLPNGQVLLMASPGEYNLPSAFFLFDGSTLKQTAGTPNQKSLSSYYGKMLVLPTGAVLLNDGVGGFWLYNSTGKPYPNSAPVISRVPGNLTAGQTYRLSGTQLSGLSQGAAYGDDYQSFTNFPLVRLVNSATGHVAYARTTGFVTAVAPGAASSTNFTLPTGIETGSAKLYVVANGIASKPHPVTIQP